MNNVFAHRCLMLLLILVTGCWSALPAAAQGNGSAGAAAATTEDLVQRVLQQISLGHSARQDIDALQGQWLAPSANVGRTQETRQLEQAHQELISALERFIELGGDAKVLSLRYDAWRAAASVIQIKFESAGERLQQSADGAAYIGKHQQVQAQVLSAFAQVRTVLDPLFVPGAKLSGSETKAVASRALTLLKQQRPRAAQAPVLRAQAVPFGALGFSVRRPVLSPVVVPSYDNKSEVVPVAEDRLATAYAPLNDEIINQAKSLDNDYVQIYEFVRNSIRNEWYAGSIKGAVGVLRSGAGNDVDQASLLSALLRAAGLSTRYVQGVIEMPVERIASELGLPTSEASQVPAALTKAGVAFSPVERKGRVEAVHLSRIWVSVYAPYTNYRGALVDASGKTWIPLDPFYKTVATNASTGLFSRSFTATALMAEYQARTSSISFIEFLRLKVTNALAGAGLPGSWESQRSTSAVQALKLDILPNSLPYPVIAVTREASDLPASEQSAVRIRLHQGPLVSDAVVLDAVVPMTDAINSRITLSYGPASIEDHRVSLLYGGRDAVPLYLIGLRGQLKVGGDIAVAATERVEPGANLRLRIELRGPWGTQEVEQTVMAGAYQALVLGNDPQRPATPAASDGEYLGARLLDGLGVYYQRQWGAADRDLAGWLDAGIVRALPDVTLVSTTMRTAYVGDVPITLEWTGVSLDAALRPVDAIGARAGEFMALSALAGSSLEQKVFQEQFSVEALSADRGIQLANEKGLKVLELTGSNIGSIDATDHAAAVKAAVRELVRLGFSVRLPERQQTVVAWTGSVWQAFKEGRAGYFISGQLAGGTTVVPPAAWTLGFLADALAAMNTEPANTDPRSGVKVVKIGAGDGQRGTVGEALATPLDVLVTDQLGRPVKGAQVTFSVVNGEAKLNGGGSSITVATNALGMATVNPTLGTSTGSNPVYIFRNPDDEFAQQVGSVWIDATVDSVVGDLQLREPFFALALPDAPARILITNPWVSEGYATTWVATLNTAVVDRFDNPISNIVVDGSINSTPASGSSGAFIPGAIFDASSVAIASKCPDGVVLGLCGSTSLTLKTREAPAVFFGVILSNDGKGGTSQVTLSAGGLKSISNFSNFAWACLSDPPKPDYQMLVVGGALDKFGNNVAASLVGQVFSNEYLVQFLVQNCVSDRYYNWVKTTGTIDSVDVSGGSAVITGTTFKVRPGTIGLNIPTVNGSVGGQSITAVGSGVYGVRPTISSIVSQGVGPGVDANKIHLDGEGLSLYPIQINYKVEPDGYQNDWTAVLLRDDVIVDYVAGDSRSKVGKAVIPRGFLFDASKYAYQVRLTSAYVSLQSEKFNLPLRQKLIVNAEARGASRYADVVNKRVCERPGLMSFVLTQSAAVKISYQRLDGSGAPIGAVEELVGEKVYPEGFNEEPLSAGVLGSGDFKFTVEARSLIDPAVNDRAERTASVILQTTNALPVGQILVHGVNMRNGILTHQTPRMSLPGRGQAFEFVASYSSAGAGNLSTAGANWSHNHDLGLYVNSCGEVVLSTGDSGSQRFFPTVDGGMSPDKGYHGTLVANPGVEKTWDYYSKDGTQHHYKFFGARVQWKLVYVKDRNGNITSYNYDTDAFPEPLLTSVERSDGRKLTFSYKKISVPRIGSVATPQNLLIKVQDSGDNEATLEYDDLGNLVRYVLNGRSTDYTYSSGAAGLADRYRLLQAKDAAGNTASYDYDKSPLDIATTDGVVTLDHVTVKSLTTPLGASMALTIDPVAWLTSTAVHTPGGGTPSGTTVYTFNVFGNPLTITDPAGTTTMEWTDVLMTAKTDGRGVKTTYSYDAHGNLTREEVDGLATTASYEIQTTAPYSKSRLLSRVDRNGNATSYTLDGKGNTTIENLPIGKVQHSYAGNGDRTASTDPNGKTTTFEYDTWGNLIALTNPVAARMETPRDKRGRIIASTDGNGNKTSYVYDAQDNLTSQTDPEGGQRVSTFDAIGNKLTERDEGGRTTTYSYSKGSLLSSISLSGTGGSPASRTFTFDGAGNKLTETDWNGNTTTYQYDSALRLVKRTEPLAKSTTYSYDPVGNLLTETTADRSSSHQYDALSRRTQTTDPQGQVWTFEFDGNGNKTASTDPLGRRTSMVYDAMNRLTAVNQPLGRSTSYTYDNAGNKTRETDPNGNITTFEYDGVNRLTTQKRPDGNTVAYVYDLANNLTRQTDAGGGITLHSYDKLNRKTSTKDPEGATTSFQYDPLGNLVQEAWPNGNVVNHSYDLFNRKASSSDSLGSIGQWTHDASGNLLEEIDGQGNTTTHTVNALNQRTRTTLPDSKTLSYELNVFGDILKATDARGNTTTTVYDKLSRAVQINSADGGKVDIEFDAAGNITRQTDPLGRATVTTYDELNRPIKVTDPLGHSISSTYDNVGNLLTQTDKRGTLTEHAYDSLNRKTSTRKAAIELELLTYTPLSQVATLQDANGRKTSFTYDKRGLQTGVNAPEGASSSQVLDAMGDAVQSTDAQGRVSTTTFDARRRVTKTTNPAGEATQFEYDRNNQRTAQVRPSGARSTYIYNSRNWLTQVSEPESRTTRYQRDGNGNLTQVTDGAGRSIEFAYDTQNRRNRITYPGGASQTFTYDAAGNLKTHLDANGISVTRVFDTLNRETSKAYSTSSDGLLSITTTYDANSNPLAVTESYSSSPSRTTTTTYDPFDRPLTTQDGFGAKQTYAYDLVGNRKSLTTQDGKTTLYGYDGLNRLTGLSSPAGSVAYVYDKTGLVLQQTSSNGTVTSTTYDAASRPKRITLSKGVVTLNLTEYNYDINGNRTQERINRPGGAQVTTYSFDAADRLTQTVLTAGADTTTTSWTYDAADNRLTENTVKTGSGAGSVNRSYIYDSRNQLKQISDSVAGTTTLTYDPQGNLKQKTQGANNTNFVWSARDLITEISRNGTVLGQYTSDHMGLRVSKEALDPLNPAAPPRRLNTQWDEQQAVQDRDSSGTVIARYDFAGRHPVALWSAENGNQHLHADALGSIVATTNPSGAVQSETLYDAWGNPTTKAGASANKFAYTGHQADAETGLYYFKARYYDPEIGRFISQDPADGQDGKPASYHRYLYAYGNPTVYIDPTGMYSWKEFGDDVATTAGLGTGLALGVATSTVEGVVGLANVVSDIDRARYGDPFAQQRNVQRGKALLHAVTNPGEMARRAKNYINTEEAGAAREYGEGNAFTAGVVRGKVVGEVATVLIPAAQMGVSGAKLVVQATTKASATAAMEGTATVGKVAGPAAQSTSSSRPVGQVLTTEASTGAAAEGAAVDAAKSVQAARSVDQPMHGSGGAAGAESVTGSLFRGTSAGYPGNPGLQRIGITPTSTDPGVATVFATESATSHGNGVVHIAKPKDLIGVDIFPAGNTSTALPAIEAEVGVGVAPAQFANKASITITAEQARSILANMGIEVPAKISKGQITSTLESTIKLTPAQIQQFTDSAKQLAGKGTGK